MRKENILGNAQTEQIYELTAATSIIHWLTNVYALSFYHKACYFYRYRSIVSAERPACARTGKLTARVLGRKCVLGAEGSFYILCDFCFVLSGSLHCSALLKRVIFEQKPSRVNTTRVIFTATKSFEILFIDG